MIPEKKIYDANDENMHTMKLNDRNCQKMVIVFIPKMKPPDNIMIRNSFSAEINELFPPNKYMMTGTMNGRNSSRYIL